MPSKRSIKYLLKPGMIKSAKDNDMHYISFAKLARCYGVRIDECIDGSATSFMIKGWTSEQLAKLITLAPRRGGDYRENLIIQQRMKDGMSFEDAVKDVYPKEDES